MPQAHSQIAQLIEAEQTARRKLVNAIWHLADASPHCRPRQSERQVVTQQRNSQGMAEPRRKDFHDTGWTSVSVKEVMR